MRRETISASAGGDESQSDDDTFCTATSYLTSDSSDHHMINVAYLFNKIARQQSKGREVDIDKSYRRAKSNPVPSKRLSINNESVPMHVPKSPQDHRRQSSPGDEADAGDTSTVASSHSDRSWSSYEEKSASQDKVILKLAVRVNKSEEKVQKLTDELNKQTMRVKQLEKEIDDLKLASGLDEISTSLGEDLLIKCNKKLIAAIDKVHITSQRQTTTQRSNEWKERLQEAENEIARLIKCIAELNRTGRKVKGKLYPEKSSASRSSQQGKSEESNDSHSGGMGVAQSTITEELASKWICFD